MEPSPGRLAPPSTAGESRDHLLSAYQVLAAAPTSTATSALPSRSAPPSTGVPVGALLSAYQLLTGKNRACADVMVRPTAGDRPAVVNSVSTSVSAARSTVRPPAASVGVTQQSTLPVPPRPTVRALRWPTACISCGKGVPQGVDAALCMVPTCKHMRCVACWPDLEKDLVCPEHATRVTMLRTVRGTATLVAAIDPIRLPTPQGAREGLSVLIDAASVVLATIPDGSADAMHRAVRNFRNFVRFFDVEWGAITANVVAAYVVARCAPPTDAELPEWMVRPVEVSTVGTELSALRRWARMADDGTFLACLSDDLVFRIIRHLSGGAKRTKTSKRPILITHVRDLVDKGVGKAPHGRMADSDARFWRDVTLLVVGLLAGLRRREIAGLDFSDLRWDAKMKELTVSVRRDKTNQNIVDTQCPRVVVVAHALLDVCWGHFVRSRGTVAGPCFRVIGTDRGIAPETVATIVRERLPGLGVSPHSLRVGCATELFAAGTPPPTIMEIGRWTSMAALRYVLPSAEVMAKATRSMGEGTCKVDRIVLQRALGTDAVAPRVHRSA